MMGAVGQCRLCLNRAELQDSHFTPQAAYKLLRGTGKNPHPIVAQQGRATQTAVQTRAHLLCHDCEQRLCKNGEDAFFRYCYRGPGKFKLLHILLAQAPLLEDDLFAAYAVPKSKNSIIEQIGYMGLSIFWKSAAYAWRDGDCTLASISLGSPYEEQVRHYLLKSGPFPEHAAMIVEVSDERNRLISVTGTPATSKWPTHYLHCIDICGITFKLFIGSRMPRHMKDLSVFRPGKKCVLLAKQQEAMLARTYHEHLKALAGLRQRQN
jgi:hypothetical protein